VKKRPLSSFTFDLLQRATKIQDATTLSADRKAVTCVSMELV
jgi:hypothetical protein